MIHRPTRSPLFPYTTLFRSQSVIEFGDHQSCRSVSWSVESRRKVHFSFDVTSPLCSLLSFFLCRLVFFLWRCCVLRSEEHTSELQSRPHLVCRLLLEKKKK